MVPINFRKVIQKASFAISPKEVTTKAKLLAAIAQQVPKALIAIGAKGYAKSINFRNKMKDLFAKIIPTEIDNSVIEFDKKLDSKYVVPFVDKMADRIWSSIKDDPRIRNAHFDAAFAEQENEQRRKTYITEMKQKYSRNKKGKEIGEEKEKDVQQEDESKQGQDVP